MPAPITTGRFRTSVYIDQPAIGSFGVSPLDVFRDSAGLRCGLRAWLLSDRIGLDEEVYLNGGNATATPHTASVVPTVRKWTELLIDVDLEARTASLAVDSVRTVGPFALTCNWSAGTTTDALIGVYYSRGDTGQRLLFDHVVFDAH